MLRVAVKDQIGYDTCSIRDIQSDALLTEIGLNNIGTHRFPLSSLFLLDIQQKGMQQISNIRGLNLESSTK